MKVSEIGFVGRSVVEWVSSEWIDVDKVGITGCVKDLFF
jgi:hypothetical protein